MRQREIRVLQTEIGTRGRLAQLERWNANFIRLSAPSADQILEGSFQLASMVRPPAKPALDAPIVLASAPAPERNVEDKLSGGARPDQLLQTASYSPSAPAADKRPAAKAPAVKVAEAKPAAKPAKPKAASADPLAPLGDKSAPDKKAKAAATGDDREQ